MVLLEHLDVGVFWETVFAGAGKVGCFPAGAVEVLLDLRWHAAGGKLD